ncbi:MAG: hypothetical protein A3K66_02200 [Euryarchaeota archaeon RBG_16_67_27]|nr:MAG: hypothetical protein A3K66_02200 [Euryarchaeota archaeon RBG_16_67_27]
MASPVAPRWERWTSSAPVLRFLLVTGGLWAAALALFALGRPDLAVVATGLGAAAPIPILYLTVHAQAQVWALRLDAATEVTASALDRVPGAHDIDRVRIPRGSPLRRCARVLRVSDPACLIGWLESPPAAAGMSIRPVVLVSARADSAGLDAFRTAVADALAG